MKSSASLEEAAPGRPPEIEAPTNRWLVHPVSRALVDRLVRTPITPNQVSVASVVAAPGALRRSASSSTGSATTSAKP